MAVGIVKYYWNNQETTEAGIRAAKALRGLDSYIGGYGSCGACPPPPAYRQTQKCWRPVTGWTCCSGQIQGYMFECGLKNYVQALPKYKSGSYRIINYSAGIRTIGYIGITSCGRGPATISPPYYWTLYECEWYVYY
jgi:hypothetical protein